MELQRNNRLFGRKECGLYYVLCLASSETDLRCSYIRFSVVALVFACGPEVAEISSLATLKKKDY
jgi:hypothetical protein